MYAALGFETLTMGLGTGAFSVLLLRMTQKRFSATQYALFSWLFSLPRLIAGPITGFAVHAVGWETFFWLTVPAGIPGLLMLARFVPPGVREPRFTIEPPRFREPLGAGGLALRGATGAVVGAAGGALILASLEALGALKEGRGFDLGQPLAALLRPEDAAGWVSVVGLVAFGLVSGLFTAAVAAARHGAGRDLAPEE